MDNVGIVIQKFFDTIIARRAEMEECLAGKEGQMCLLWRQFEKVIYMEMGTAINETRDHNGEKHRILIPTDWTFN